VDIPQPSAAPAQANGLRQVLKDAAFGWNYLRERTGLLFLVLYFALVNFLLNFSAVLSSPLVLARETSAVAGVIQAVAGGGMLAGSVVISTWGGPKKRIRGVIGAIAISAVGLTLIGVNPSPVVIGLGFFLLMFGLPVASGCSITISQLKIEPSVQGRTQAIRMMISRSMMPLAYLIAGPLADYVFEPAFRAGGALEKSWIANLIGSGPGRGIGLIFIISGLFLLLVTLFAALEPHIRHVETDLPDMLPESSLLEANPAGQPEPAE